MAATVIPPKEPCLHGKDKPSPPSKRTSDEPVAERRGAVAAGWQSKAIVACPACHKKLRWGNRWPGRAVCPICGLRLVVLWDDLRAFSASAENEDSVADMICDWLDDDSEAE